MLRTSLTLIAMNVSLCAAPILFVGFDLPAPGDTGYPNGQNARNQFLAYLQGAGTASFAGDICANETCPMAFAGFNGTITGLFLQSSPNPAPGGAAAVRAQGEILMSFSTGISAVGFYLNNVLYLPPAMPGDPDQVLLTIDGRNIFIDPAQYGITTQTRYSGFIGYIDPEVTFQSAGFNMLMNSSFDTALVTAATPDQVVPEPSATASLAAVIATGWWIRRRR
jgi:hypothetical protein